MLEGQQARLTQAALETLGRGRLPAAHLARPGLRDPWRQRRRRDAHPDHARAGAGGRSRPESGAALFRTTSYFLERIGVTSIDDLPELAPYLPDMDDFEDELAEVRRTGRSPVGDARAGHDVAASGDSAEPAGTASDEPSPPTTTA